MSEREGEGGRNSERARDREREMNREFQGDRRQLPMLPGQHKFSLTLSLFFLCVFLLVNKLCILLLNFLSFSLLLLPISLQALCFSVLHFSIFLLYFLLSSPSLSLSYFTFSLPRSFFYTFFFHGCRLVQLKMGDSEGEK